MGVGKTAGVILGFVAAFAIGVWVGPHITHQPQTYSAIVDTSTAAPPTAATAAAPAPRARVRANVAPRVPQVAITEPALHERLRPVLNRGANMAMAADGFKSAEDFATVAHAARNTSVPFMLLKHRVLEEGKSVAEAIRESKPTADAADEARNARAQARSDIAALAG